MAIAPVTRTLFLVVVLAIGALPSAPPRAQAQSALERQLLGLGAAVILNEMNRSQQPQQQQRQQQNRPQAQGQQRSAPQAPRIDPARQAAMDLQRNLNALGFDAGPVDGLPGARTRSAIQAYQVSRGFSPTGSLTSMQRLALDTDVRASASGGVETAELRRTEVYEAQAYLQELGYNPGTPDGAWGPRSQSALDAFRRDAGLAGFGAPLAPGDEAALYARVHGVPPNARPGMARVMTAQTMAPTSVAQAGPSFDCNRAGTPTEFAICGNPRLAALDRQLAEAWSAAVSAAGGSGSLLPRHQAWMAQRNACGGDPGCIDAQMTTRITELTGAPPAPQGFGNFAGGGSAGNFAGGGSSGTFAGGGTGGFDGGGTGFGSGAAGGFGVASFGADGVSVPGASAGQGAPSPVAAAAWDTPTLGSGDWAHLARGRFLQAPDGLERRLMLAEIKLAPETLANDRMVERNLVAQRAQQSGQTYNQANAEFARLNPIERADALEAHRRQLLEAAQGVTEVSPANPVPLAIYLEWRGANQHQRLEYVDGQGIRILADTGYQVQLPGSQGYGGGFTVTGVLPGIDILPMGRDEASAFLNSHQAQTADRKRLAQVVWGRLTRLGVDESVADFASTNALGNLGYGGDRPVTFVPERVTLHYVDQGNGPGLVGPETPVLYEWPLDSGAAPTQGGREALVVARELGLPIQDGHVVANAQTRENQEGWWTFTNLAWVGANPDVAREGDNFAAVATALLPDMQKRAFFGDRQVGQINDLARLYNPERPEGLGNYATNAFRDEFLREDAKRAFLANYYDAILARTPQWPLPLLHKVQLNLDEYDFDAGAFPIQGLENATFRVASTNQLQVTERSRQGLYSVDRFGNLPTSLPMPSDQARRLRDALRAAYPHGGAQITLAWWSDLDWGTDATETENLFSPRYPVQQHEPRPGRGTLKRVALFLDPGLSQPLMEIDPEAVLIPNPEVVGPDAGEASALARITQPERATGPRLLAAVARGLGGDDAAWQRLARTQQAVLQANEFDAPGALTATVEALKAQPEGPVWIEGTAQLAEYDLTAGTFAFTEGSGYVRFNMRGDTGNTTIAPTLVGVDPFQSLPVEPELARAIVEAAEPGRRQVSFLMRATPKGVTDKSHPRQVDERPSFDLILQPEEILFWRQDRYGEVSEVLAALSYDDANAERADRLATRYEPSEFSALAEARPVVDPHVFDLLLVRATGQVPEGEAGSAMMLAAWQNERGDEALPGPRFFENDPAMPQGPEAEVMRPSFASYMQAKAAALGDRFAVEMARNQRQQVCSKTMEAYGMYGGDLAVFQALPQMREDANALGQRLRETQEAVEVPRRYAMIQQRPSARYSNCEVWYGVVVLEDAVNEGHSGGDAPAVRVEFVLEDVAQYAGSNPLPDMILRGKAGETRLLAADGTVGPVVEAAMPVAEADPEPQAQPQPQAAAQAAPAAQPPSAAPDGSAESGAHWPELAGFEMEPAEIDLLGLRTGQSMDEAERIIVERGGVLAGFETPPEAASDMGSPAMAYRRVYVTRDGNEAISLGSYAPDGPVVALMRRMVLPEGTLPYDRISEALVEKYGAPDGDGAEIGMDGLSVWLNGASGPNTEICGAIPYSGQGLYGWARLGGVGAPEWEEPRGRGPWQMGLPEYPPEMLQYMTPCDVVLAYREERPEQWGGVSGFSVLMVDFDAIRRAEEAMDAGEAPVEIEIEF